MAYSPDFIEFWSEYPNKRGKSDAWKAWQRIDGRPEIDVILTAVQHDRISPEWRKEKGRFIPHPTSWLNGRRWEDEGLLSPGSIDPTQPRTPIPFR